MSAPDLSRDALAALTGLPVSTPLSELVAAAGDDLGVARVLALLDELLGGEGSDARTP